jgi:hypothetical protein
VRLRSPRWVEGAVEREEDGLSCSGAKEMPASQAEARWRGMLCGERRRRGGAAERGRGELSRRCGKVSFFSFLDSTVGASERTCTV